MIDFVAASHAIEAARWCVPHDTGLRADDVFLVVSNGEVQGETFGGEQLLRSGCFIAAGAVIDQTGQSNQALCL
jgi:hypothetical protein